MTESLELTLQLTGTLSPVGGDELPNDIVETLQVACERLEESGRVRFIVRGFGGDPWPLDVGVDLVTVLEQLPTIADALDSGAERFELDFFEQGIQRRLDFSRSGGEMTATCVSATDWRPRPEKITLPVVRLTRQLAELRDKFVEYATACVPRLAAHPSFQEWMESTRFR